MLVTASERGVWSLEMYWEGRLVKLMMHLVTSITTFNREWIRDSRSLISGSGLSRITDLARGLVACSCDKRQNSPKHTAKAERTKTTFASHEYFTSMLNTASVIVFTSPTPE